MTEPRLVEILIKNSGRRDIQVSDFANAENSLIFDFGAPVISILDSRVEPSTSAPAVTSHAGSELRLHPGLIAKGQTVQLSVLVDGPEQDARLKVATILETPARRGNQLEFEKTSRRLFRASQIALPILVAIATVFVTTSVIRVLDDTDRALQRNTKGVEDASKAVKEASDLLTLLRNCRYWDVYDPERAKKECPKVTVPKRSDN
ncbi:hypothetical protein [Streptomyces adelaidensis]|uniref:hypothetical protein n=1 Tax=Streptomyces adelaidensis TaxID=2796465 RepID=UPI0019085589|nr:hypothetical protein [Streptomyces adelaidensis]